MNIAVLASGNGTNFEAIVKAAKRGYIRANIKLLITDKKDAYARTRAKKLGVQDIFINPKDFYSRLEFDKSISSLLKREKINLVVLAGFMRILSPYFVRTFKNRILNIHPALLPAFRGERAIERAFGGGCKATGVTVHFVDESVDHGPIVLQEAIIIKEGETLKELEAKVHKLEHELYPLAIKLYVENRLKIKGRRVAIGC
ncbi:MAG: phosphoribosylglycinamide formyltransferase [Candidatus Omnitrophica bacterium]|nr:phosphoribosylglycinamide formyltransferase [Candidatus Omnitrophota bacterium]